MIKQIENRDFLPEVKVYSGIKDYFGRNCIILANDDLNEIRVVMKDSDYSRRRKFLDSHGHSNVGVQRYGEVINFTEKVANEIEEFFRGCGYCHSQWEIR